MHDEGWPWSTNMGKVSRCRPTWSGEAGVSKVPGAITDWRPLHEAHSIQVASLTILFGQALTDVPWRKAITEGRALARELGLTVERNVPVFSFALVQERATAPVPPAAQVPHGVEFMRLRTPTFAEEKLIYDLNSLRYENWAYTRWAAFLDRALALVFSLMRNYYLPSVPILGIGVDYNDRFYSADGLEAPDAGQVIRPDSPLIAAGAFKRIDPWHVHSGWFEACDDQTKRLFNVDIDVADMPPGVRPQGAVRALQLRTAAVDHFNQPGLREMPNDDVTVAFVSRRLQMMHEELKRVLEAVLTDSATATIGLKGNI